MAAPWRLLIGSAFLAGLLGPPPAVAQDVQKHVLIVWGGRADLPVNVVVNQAIRKALFDAFGSDVDLRFEYVEDRSDEREQRAQRDFLRQKYDSYRFDLLIAIAGSAIDFARTYSQGLFPGTPVLCWGQASDLGDWSAGPPFTAVVFDLDPRATVEFILSAQPATRRLMVIAGGSPYDDLPFLARVRAELRRYEGRLEVTYLLGQSLEDVRRRVARLPGHTAILYVSMHGDGAGRRLVNVDAMSSIAASASAPVYVMVASHMGAGALGGVVGSQEALAEVAGRVAVRLLRGARVQDVPITHVPLVPMVDWRQLRRFGIAEAGLPPRTVILYREQSLWEKYRWRLFGIAALCVGQALLIVALLVQGARRRRAERAEKQQQRQLAHLSRVAMVGELTGTLAHELNQPLTAILSNANAACHLLDRGQPDVAEAREALGDIVSDTRRARDVMTRLRGMLKRTEAQLQTVNVNDVVREVVDLAHGDLITRGVAVTLQLQEDLPAVAADRVQIQQVLLNLVLNGCDAMADVAPSGRSLTVASGTDGDGQVLIRVRDHGTGIASEDLGRIFEPFYTSKREGLGLGLAICRTIAADHGGRLWATNNEGDRGATLHLALPRGAAVRPGTGS
jgi:signal transduction histidine kinase